MIREFALEPELVASWTDRRTCRYYLEQFGLGTGRIVSRFPKKWQRRVLQAFDDSFNLQELSAEERGRLQVRQKRIEVLLVRLTEVMVQRRGHTWNPDEPWLTNALAEHARVAFDAILARAPGAGVGEVLSEADCDNDHARWLAPRSRVVRREAPDLKDCVVSMLRSCSEVIFVDPHFGPEKKRYLTTMRGFLRAVFNDRPGDPPRRVEIHSASLATPEFFRSECVERLGRLIPVGATIQVWHLKARPACEELHNRYILTDLGGVSFGAGLDLGPRGQRGTDDVQILDRETYTHRWQQHLAPEKVFEARAAVFDVTGKDPAENKDG